MVELEKSDIGEAGESATTRARLESVVPAPAPPPLAKPVALLLWLSGQLPPTQKYRIQTESAGTAEATAVREKADGAAVEAAATEAVGERTDYVYQRNK
jgi:hypothetical protein